MGRGYSGFFSGTKGAGGQHPIERNANGMTNKYPLTQHGYFGVPGKGHHVRVIYSDSPIATSKDFYDCIRKGGREEVLQNGHGRQTVFPDKSRVVYRVYSKSGSPAVEIRIINPSKVSQQKIHFEEKKK